MIYLRQTTGLQEVRIPHTGLEYNGPAVLEFTRVLGGELVAEFGMVIVAASAYHAGNISLPEDMAGGGAEYFYALRQGGARVACGVAVVGEPSRIAEPSAGSVANIVIKEYGE